MKKIGYILIVNGVILMIIKHLLQMTGDMNFIFSAMQIFCSIFGILFIVKGK